MAGPTNGHGSEASPLLHLKPLPSLPMQDETPTPHAVSHASSPSISPLNPITQEFRPARVDDKCRKLDASKSWVPVALRRRSLIVFIATYVALISVLAVLFDYSNKHNGLATSDQKLHYLWTYGPTAVFTAVAALWTKVDYHAKQLAPWRSLASEPASAQRSVLLDYVSAWNVKALIDSARARHFHVTLAIAGKLALQFMIIFSTGLFTLEQRTVIRHGAPLTTNFRFANVTNHDVDARSFMTAMASRQYNLTYPRGTTENFAYQTFNVSKPDLPSNTTITAEVDAFHPDLECNVVNATWEITPDPTSTRGEGLYQWDIQTTDADCPLTTGVRGVPLNQLAGYYAEDYYRPLGEDGPISSCIRWWLWVAHVELDNRNHTVEIPAYGNVTARGGVSTISSISCQPKFEMRKARIVTDGIKFNSSLIENSASSTLANVTAWNLLDSVIASKDRARSILRGTNGEFTSSIGNVTLHSDIFLLMNLTMPRKDREGWMDSSFLIESARKSFQSVATQVVLGSLVEPIEGNSTATLTWTENRLVLQALSFYLIVSLLIILIAVAAVLGFSTPIGVVPLDPGSIAGTAAIVASSFDLNQNLKTAGYSAAATKVRAMASAPYHAGIRGRRFCISSSVGQDSQNLLTLATTQRQKWWQPFHGTLLGKLTVLLAPLAGIAVIEALYQTSRKHHGIAFVSVDGYDHYAWVYLPAFVIWLINLSFESVYDLTTIVQPYHMLRRKAATAEDALTYNLQGNILFHNTWLAFAKRRYTVLFASVAVLLGSSLPIAVAGLYTPDETVRLSVIPLQQSTYFNASQGFYQDELPYEGTTLDGDEPPSVKQNGDSMANLVLYNNLSYPRGTYNTFALGEFIIPDSELSNIVKGTYSSVTVQLPAVRGRVNCTSVPQENIYANPVPISSGEISADNPAYIPIQSLTSKGCWNSTGTWAGYTTFEGIANSIEREFIFGRLAGSQVNGGGGDQDTIWPVENKSVTDAGYHGYTAMPAQCPRGMITFGKGLHENKTGIPSDTLTDITVMHCWPYVEQVVLNTTFSVPSMDIISANPLPPDPSLPGGYPFFSEAEILENAGMPVGRGVPQLWANYLSSLETPNDTMAYAFDLFIEAVVWGKGGIPVSELLGPENEDRLIARVDEVYGTIMAQLYNGQGRIPALPDATTLNGTAVNQNQYRVVQSLISTRILEAVLAAMFVCCALAFWELDMKELLPQNPCSIAAAASFVAGSRLVDRSIMPEGSEFLSVKEMMKKGTFDGLKFRMGWWGEGKVKRFGIDVLDSRDAVTEKLVKERTVESDRSTITPPKPPAPSTLETQTPTNRSPARISTNVRPGSPDVSPLEPYT